MLTKKQKELFVYLRDYISSNDISPSFEEMKNAVNLKSKSSYNFNSYINRCSLIILDRTDN